MSHDEMFETQEVKHPLLRAGIGHNNPPVVDIETAKRAAAEAADNVVAWLQRRDEDLLTRIVDLAAAIKDFPKVLKTAIDAEKASDFRSQIKAAMAAADLLRTTDKKAFEKPANIVHSFWKKQTDSLDMLDAHVAGVLRAYLVAKQAKVDEANRKAAEAAAKLAAEMAAKNHRPAPPPPPPVAAPVRARGDGGSVSSLTKKWTFENLDRAAVDLEALRPYLADVAIDAAILAAIRDGVRTLKGCDIVERPVLTTR